MKKLIIFLLLCLVMAGCGAYFSTEQYMQENPNAKPFVIDEDGDGIGDAVGLLDENGNPVIDPETNKPAEFPDSRAGFEQAKQTDASIENILYIAGACTGLGGAVGRLWGSIKPTARANDLAIKIKGLVRSVQAVREHDKLDETALALIDETLQQVQSTVEGLESTVVDVKAEIKKEQQLKIAA